VYSELACGYPPAGQLDHPWALVDSDHPSTPRHQLLGVQSRTACRVQHGAPSHVAEQPEAGRPVVVSVVEAVFGMLEEVIGEHVVLRIRAH